MAIFGRDGTFVRITPMPYALSFAITSDGRAIFPSSDRVPESIGKARGWRATLYEDELYVLDGVTILVFAVNLSRG